MSERTSNSRANPIDSLKLTGASGRHLLLPPDAVVLFLDETGHEGHADPTYPIFGLGGCVVSVSAYRGQLYQPWRDLKAEHLGDPDCPLHAAELGGLRHAVAPALGEFFHTHLFGRIAALTTRETVVPPRTSAPWLLAGVVLKRMGRLLNVLGLRPSQICVLVEDSQRLGQQLAKHLDGYRVESKDGTYSLKPEVLLLPKHLNEPGLEVADFVMHAGGGTVRGWRDLGQDPNRADFESVFRPHGVPHTYVEYLEVMDVQA